MDNSPVLKFIEMTTAKFSESPPVLIIERHQGVADQLDEAVSEIEYSFSTLPDVFRREKPERARKELSRTVQEVASLAFAAGMDQGYCQQWFAFSAWALWLEGNYPWSLRYAILGGCDELLTQFRAKSPDSILMDEIVPWALVNKGWQSPEFESGNLNYVDKWWVKLKDAILNSDHKHTEGLIRQIAKEQMGWSDWKVYEMLCFPVFQLGVNAVTVLARQGGFHIPQDWLRKDIGLFLQPGLFEIKPHFMDKQLAEVLIRS